MKKRTLIFALLSLLIIERGAKAEGVTPKYWGPTTHVLITMQAIGLLLEKGSLSEEQKEEINEFEGKIIHGSWLEDFSGGGRRPDNHAYDTHEQDWESIIMPQPLIGQKG